jgi:hypothetical protein
MRYRGKHVHTITREDVGKSSVKLPACPSCGKADTLSLAGSSGYVQAHDVGKMVMDVGGVIQVESDDQLAARLTNQHAAPIHRISDLD